MALNGVKEGSVIRLHDYMRGLVIVSIDTNYIKVKDKRGCTFCLGMFLTPFLSIDAYVDNESATTLEEGIDRLARTCKAKLRSSGFDSKATLKDLRVLACAILVGDYKHVHNTKLYALHSVEYTRALEVFEYMKQGRILNLAHKKKKVTVR